MTEDQIRETFDKHGEEFLEFERVVFPKSKRPDLHAFLLLDTIVPGDMDIVAAAEHDEIWLDIELEDLAVAGVTEEQIIELLRCGVRVDDNGLCMYV